MSDDPRDTKIVELERENRAYRVAIDDAARWLRGPLRADTLNEAIRALNRVLTREERLSEVAWGVASLSALQKAVRNLCDMTALPEYAAFLTQQIGNGPPAPMQRQPSGGIRYPADV